MGFVPIFLTLGGFVLLFVMVVHISIKNKKEQFLLAYKQLAELLHKPLPPSGLSSRNLNELEESASAAPSSSIKKQLGTAKILRHRYQELIKEKPYNLIAKIMGHTSI
ncbi:hypothetical protein QWY93_12180 [Echinicola jeungdonensis]|uniref:Uncharacterized protein n=1 Tax=Echinicola jeungdonensis TaxID=709343 RepID=A0ABV5J461_9BACT|nr:hypothetical protein [Echinicola jeungdonensis]MDN3670082.1 hypothetical protein [Echinicola jeungdonensis]